MSGTRFAIFLATVLLLALLAWPRPPAKPTPPEPPEPKLALTTLERSKTGSEPKPPVEVPDPTLSHGAITLANGPALDPKILDRVRDAAVFLQVKHVSYLDEKVEQESSGSGFFISRDGRIVTCWHVIHAQQEAPELIIPLEMRTIEAVIGSGTRRQLLFPARVLAADPENDLAILKIDYHPEAWLELGDSSQLVPTLPVWVLGYPLGKVFSVLQRGPEYSINRGYISSLRHDDLERLDRIQFDAAVTPGNSGGAVFGNDGKVIGVANIAFGTSRVNFAVPAAKVARLLEGSPLDRRAENACAVEVTSNPSGAQVFLDGKARGATPLKLNVPAAYSLVQVSAPDRRNWIRRVSLYDGLTIHAELRSLDRKTLKTARQAGKPAPDTKPVPLGAPLLEQDFSDPRAADAWRQDTGGVETRTWYVEGGALHQWNGDAMLHAIYAGNEAWTNYAFTARVQIALNEKDGRAGLIFRASPDGFALFRLHRDKRVVQLAYHSNDPFGWQVLAEHRLAAPVEGGRWYQMEVQAVGKRVRCFLDGQAVLEAVLDLAPEGNVGFYSVDAQASFDDARVLKLEAKDEVQTPEATVNSYWFNENYQRESTFWNAFVDEHPAPPWPTVNGACLRLDRGIGPSRNILMRYDLCDSRVAVKASCAEGVMGLVLRDDGKRRYVCAVDCDSGRVFVRLDDGATQKVLAEKTEPRIRDAVHVTPGTQAPLLYLMTQQNGPDLKLRVVVIGSPDLKTLLAEDAQKPDGKAQVSFGVLTQVEVQTSDATLTRGRVGLYADHARSLFHSLQVSDDGEE